MPQTFNTYYTTDKLKPLFPDIYSGADSSSFFIAFVRDEKSDSKIKTPFCFHGFLLLYCIEGRADVNIDNKLYTVEGRSVLVVFSGAVVSLVDRYPAENSNLVILALNIELIDQLPCDFKNSLPADTLLYRRALLELEPSMERILRTQISLAVDVSTMDNRYSDDITNCMFSIVFYLLMSLMSAEEKEEDRRNSSRTLVLVSRFIQLLKENYKNNRDISFYSAKLGVSANYLSQRLKSTTGHNASDWIDTYLLSEAKNLLLMTTKPIQAVSDELNFSGQASFAKYFKDRTGMTPSQFRRR